MRLTIKHRPTQVIISHDIKLANTFFDRLVGLMFKDEMIGYEGLMLTPCKSVHNFFVRFPIDLIFLSKDDQVVRIIRNFKPWHMTKFYFRAEKVLELKRGLLADTVNEGDYLEVIRV